MSQKSDHHFLLCPFKPALCCDLQEQDTNTCYKLSEKQLFKVQAVSTCSIAVLSMCSTKQYQEPETTAIRQLTPSGFWGGRERQMKQLSGAQLHRPDHNYSHSRFVLPPSLSMIEDYLHVKNITVSGQYWFSLSWTDEGHAGTKISDRISQKLRNKEH